MAEVLEDHIRLHMLSDEKKSSMPTAELAEDLIGLVRAYLKSFQWTEPGDVLLSFEISGKTSLAAPLSFTRLREVLVGFR